MVTLESIKIKTGDVLLEGYLEIPENPVGIVVFAHGSGSSRNSSRNRKVADYLNNLGIGTLLTDLLTPEEDLNYENRFNISLLGSRLKKVTEQVRQKKECLHLPVGYFGASTGSASALIASVDSDVKAIVSRGGRPDLAGEALNKIKAPTLLIVGGKDTGVINLNESAFAILSGIKKIEIIPGATHLFEEPGALEEAARLAGAWFLRFFRNQKPKLKS